MGDFFNFCGLLRKLQLYLKILLKHPVLVYIPISDNISSHSFMDHHGRIGVKAQDRWMFSIRQMINNALVQCLGAIHILRKHIFRHFWPPPLFLIKNVALKVNRNCGFFSPSPLCKSNLVLKVKQKLIFLPNLSP